MPVQFFSGNYSGACLLYEMFLKIKVPIERVKAAMRAESGFLFENQE